MDFSKFRASGDLSDIVVVVDGHENHLHRFPLYAKSDYFCGLTRAGSGLHSPSGTKSRVELSAFPGGQEVFGVVADFCYNMAPSITKNNVVELRCAAQLLEMSGPGNLADAADKFLQDTVASAKLSRSSSSLVALLVHCAGVGQLAESSGVVDTCTDALVDTWLRSPSKFSPAAAIVGASHGSAFTPMKSQQQLVTTLPTSSEGEVADEVTVKSLCVLPEEWFARLLTRARDRGVKQAQLADMAVRYVSHAIDSEDAEGNGEMNGHSTPISVSDSGSPVDRDGASEKDTDTAAAVEGLSLRSQDVASPERRVELGQLLDTVLTTLPEEAYNVPSVTMEWLTKVLRIATARGCSCRRFLVKIAAEMLTRLPAEDLCLVSPSVLHDIVLEARADDTQTERACNLVDTYLGEMARKGVLTAETFRLLANAAPADARRNHDNLYQVLEYVLKSEQDSLSSEQRKELLSTINLDLVSEDTLQRALDSDLVPPAPVARAALGLCSRLRSELESVKYIAQMQEEELHRFQSKASPQASPRAPAIVATSRNSDSGFSDSRESAKASPDTAGEHVRAAQSVLNMARTKLAMPLYTGHRPYLPSSAAMPHSSGSSALGYGSAAGSAIEHDISVQDELEFKFDRTFRSLDPRVRSRHLPSSGYGHSSHSAVSGTTSHHHGHRATYFPYTPRY
ncbi:hypothetical protein BaRGS_00000069 [Batillaria attramentaria]|uniref:BTB domain-containing protein n=1 Tax=Batillaria attramentaria TaxID=370345 RepID=A0ABD0MBZ6_9CAEN